MGERLGVDKLAHYASHLGLGKPTGIDVEGEKGGIVPTTEWKKKRFNQEWYPGETISVAIGQGYNLATPLQLASMYGAVAIGGKVYKPHVLKNVTDIDGKVLKEIEPEILDQIELKKRTAELIRKGLEQVVNDPQGGTAFRSRLPFVDIKMAGKTGTAQVVNYKAGERSGAKEDHAWFVGFAPAENPEIVAVALVEHGGHGSSTAAPLVSQLIQKYFELKADRTGAPLWRVGEKKPAVTINTSPGDR
jgi:penicillin-binding protein 2